MEIQGLGLVSSCLTLTFLYSCVSATEADSQDSGVVREPGQASSSPEEASKDEECKMYAKE